MFILACRKCMCALNDGSRPWSRPVVGTASDGLRPFGSGRDPSLVVPATGCDRLGPVATRRWHCHDGSATVWVRSRPVVGRASDGLRPFGSGRDPSLVVPATGCDLLGPVATRRWHGTDGLRPFGTGRDPSLVTKYTITRGISKIINFHFHLHPRLYTFRLNYHCQYLWVATVCKWQKSVFFKCCCVTESWVNGAVTLTLFLFFYLDVVV